MYTKRFLTGVCATAVAAAALVAAAAPGSGRSASVVLPPGNTVEQWNKIAEDTVVGSGAFQIEGFIYMAYESTAVYDATVSLRDGYKPLLPAFRVYKKASLDAAIVEAAYRTLTHYFPTAAPTLDPLYATALAAIPNGQAKLAGQRIGWVAANQVIRARTGDGLQTPIASTLTFPTLTPGPGVYRLTPPFAAPQTPWAANVRPFILTSGSQFRPGPPPALSSSEWVTAYNEVKTYGGATGTMRTADETKIAKFWSANTIRQYNRVARDITDAKGFSLVQTARLAAMVNDVAADAGISVMDAKYHYLFWRPITAIDPSSVSSSDGFGPTTGFSDGNSATVEQTGWKPLLAVPNHPEYPSAHGSVSGALTRVFASVLGNQLNIDIHGFDPNGAPGNFDALQHFNTADDLTSQIVNARVWAGLHYRFSGQAGVALGTSIGDYDLKHAFQPAP